MGGVPRPVPVRRHDGIEFTHAEHAKNLASGWETATWASCWALTSPIPTIPSTSTSTWATPPSWAAKILVRQLWVGLAHLIVGRTLALQHDHKARLPAAIMEKMSGSW